MNALAMEFEDDTFDLVWACESGEHMPDKKKYVEEMTRVLKPGNPPVSLSSSSCSAEHSCRVPTSNNACIFRPANASEHEVDELVVEVLRLY